MSFKNRQIRHNRMEGQPKSYIFGALNTEAYVKI